MSAAEEQYRRGAEDEARAAVAGMRPESRAVYDYVQVCAQLGDPADLITTEVALVFTADWPLRKRLALAWQLVTR